MFSSSSNFRFSCDSPTSDLETRTPKGRGKRGGRAAAVAANELNCDRKLRKGRRNNNTANVFTAPPSPAKAEERSGSKRKGRPNDIDLDGPKASKRSRSNSRSTPSGSSNDNSQEVKTAAANADGTPNSEYIECPERNCNKKYKHINGLRYHQSHAHQGAASGEEPMDDKEDSSEESNPQSPVVAPVKAEKETKEKSSKVCFSLYHQISKLPFLNVFLKMNDSIIIISIIYYYSYCNDL